MAQSVEAVTLEQILQVLGVEVFGGVLGNGGRLEIEIEIGVNGSDLNESRGEALLSTVTLIASNIEPEDTQPKNWRLLTQGEKQLAATNGIKIKNIGKVRIYRKQYTVFNEQVVTPNGHIYVDEPNVAGFPWSEDYSTDEVTTRKRSVIVHEMVHLYQKRTLGWSLIRMALTKTKSLAGGGYCFTIVEGKAYSAYNMEQQAQMVQERYLLRNNENYWLSCNNEVSEDELNSTIPF